MRPARTFPRNRKRTATTRSAPSRRFVFFHGTQDEIHQLRPLVDRLDPDVAREPRLHLAEPLRQRGGDRMAVLADEHEPEPEDGLPFPVRRRRAAPDLVPHLHLGDLPHPDRHPAARRDDHVLNRAAPVQRADAEHEGRAPPALDHAAAHVRVVGLERAVDIAHREVELLEPLRIDDDVPLLFLAAPGVHLGDPRDAPELGERSPSRAAFRRSSRLRVSLFTR